MATAAAGLTAGRLAEIRRAAGALAEARRKLDQVDRGPWARTWGDVTVDGPGPPARVSSPATSDVFRDPDPKVCAFVAAARNTPIEAMCLELVAELERRGAGDGNG